MTRTRRLTPRQTAVLAALERGGQTTLWDLRQRDFPDLAPSTISRVLDRLGQDGLVSSSGDPAKRYVGGVLYWAASREPSTEDLQLDALVAELRSQDRVAWADYERRVVSVLLPVDEILQELVGSRGAFRVLSDAVIALIDDHRASAIAAGSELTLNETGQALRIELTIPTDKPDVHVGSTD